MKEEEKELRFSKHLVLNYKNVITQSKLYIYIYGKII